MKFNLRTAFILITFASLGLFNHEARADFESLSREKSEIAITAGTFLPSKGIRGVKDNYGMWGPSFYIPTTIWDLEFEYLNARGQGVVYHIASLGIRSDFSIEKVLEVFWAAGLDYHVYKGVSRDQKSSGGFHLGFGGFFAITDVFKLRGEFKFHNGPGRSAYIGLGPAFLF